MKEGADQLAKLGWANDARVTYVCNDLGSDCDLLTQKLGAFLHRVEQPLQGVFHLAGVCDRIAVAELTEATLAAAARAKAVGAVHLHRAAAALGARPAG